MTGCRRILPARSFEESFNSQRRGIPLLEKREKWGTPSVAYADEVKRLNSQRPWNPTPSQSTRRDGPPPCAAYAQEVKGLRHPVHLRRRSISALT